MNKNIITNINHYCHRKEINDKIYDLVTYYTSKHSKVLFVRFDIRYPRFYISDNSNRDISDCFSYVIKKYKRDGLDPHYNWVREQNYSDNPHYHCVLLLDGQKCRRYSHVFDTVEAAWGRVLGCDVRGCIHHCTDSNDIDSNGILLCRSDSHTRYQENLDKVYNRLSYLSKSFSKAEESDGLRNFATSKFTNLNNYNGYERS